MTVRVPNAALAYAVLDHIDAHPEEWNQAVWFRRPQVGCGTTACFAGWTSLLSGDEPDWAHAYQRQTDGVISDGRSLYIVGRAMGLLGIDDHQADALFYGANTREDLGRLVAQIFGHRPAWTAVDEQAWRECAHRADYLTPAEHARNCGYHRGEVDEWGHPVDDVAPGRWPIPDPHPLANCGPLLMQLTPGTACPTCGTVPPVPELPVDDVAPNAGSAS